MSNQIKNVTDETFNEDVLLNNIPVLVNFWAEWCGPCKMVNPKLESLSEEFEGKIKIVSMDVDANYESPARFNVRGIPTLIIFKDGGQEGTKVGALTKSSIKEFIESTIY